MGVTRQKWTTVLIPETRHTLVRFSGQNTVPTTASRTSSCPKNLTSVCRVSGINTVLRRTISKVIRLQGSCPCSRAAQSLEAYWPALWSLECYPKHLTATEIATKFFSLIIQLGIIEIVLYIANILNLFLLYLLEWIQNQILVILAF